MDIHSAAVVTYLLVWKNSDYHYKNKLVTHTTKLGRRGVEVFQVLLSPQQAIL